MLHSEKSVCVISPIKSREYSLNFNTGESVPIFGFRDLKLHENLGSVNGNIGKNLGSTNLKSCSFVRFISVAHSINFVLHRVAGNE